MKKLLLLLLLVSGYLQAQIISFPDANLKSKLLSASPLNTVAYSGGLKVKIDANNDGEIQLAEAVAIDSLSIDNASIADITGINAFSGLKKLDCGYNQLSSLNLSLTNLKRLVCQNNWLASLDVSGLNSLEYLECTYNPMTSLNVSGLYLLKTIGASWTNFTSLDLAGLNSLETLWAEHSALTALDASGLPQLKLLYVASGGAAGPLATLEASNCPMLETVYAQQNMLTSINFTGCSSLKTAFLGGNQLTTADFSQCPALVNIYLEVNPQLESIFIKNGNTTENVSFSSCPNLTFVCADPPQLAQIQNQLIQSGLANASCSSYCSFTPGGIYNTITGSVKLDLGNDGCSPSDPGFPGLKIALDDTTNPGAVFSSNAGSYVFYAQQPNITLTPLLENPTYFNVTPQSETVNFAAIDGSSEIRNFCLTPNGTHNDLEVFIVPTVAARPGFDAEYKILYRNKGNQSLDGSVEIAYQDAVLDYVSSSVTPDSALLGNLTLNYSDLLPFESRTVTVVFNVNSPVETPAVNIGDELSFMATANPVSGDETPADNSFSFKQTVVGSFDPNDKKCLQGDIVPTAQIGGYLTYVINFENTGSFPAQNVVIKDLLDADEFDLASLQVLGASADKVVTLNANLLEIAFENIGLAPNQYGYVAYKIKTRNDLASGATVQNKANIYFDFNFPVETNTATTTFQSLGIGEQSAGAAAKIFPNPARDVLYVKSDSAIKNVSITDSQGRTIKRFDGGGNELTLDVSEVASGVYLVKISFDKGSMSQKLIKE